MRFVTLLLALPLAGCTGDLVDLTPNNSNKDAGVVGSTDLAQVVLPGGEGGMPQSVKFNPDINNDLASCTAVGCHGAAAGGRLKLTAGTDSTTVTANYASFSALANMGENSPVLAHLLAGASPAHTGGAIFQAKTDALYVKWLAWINAGNPP